MDTLTTQGMINTHIHWWNYAIENERLDLLSFLMCNKISCGTNPIEIIVDAGKISVLEFFNREYPDLNWGDALGLAANNGDFKTVRWLMKNRNDTPPKDLIDYPASSGDLKMVRFLRRHFGHCYTPNALKWAKEFNHPHIVRYLCKIMARKGQNVP